MSKLDLEISSDCTVYLSISLPFRIVKPELLTQIIADSFLLLARKKMFIHKNSWFSYR